MNSTQLINHLPDLLGDALLSHTVAFDEMTCEIAPGRIKEVCAKLRDDAAGFETLIDLCGVDYSAWGGVDGVGDGGGTWEGDRFAVVYHLLSLRNNLRLRLRVALEDSAPAVTSVVEVWPAANWYEREAFDLFGIIFHGHPDLRRLLTDYGFIGHPMRKDFPLSGQVEMRYDEAHGRVIYQPVTIEPRTLVPRTISKPVGGDARDDSATENVATKTTAAKNG